MPPPRKLVKSNCLGTSVAEICSGSKICPIGPSRKFAFTLAEVLITLGIIGIVAALVMPGFISQHNKNVTITKLKEAYSIFSQTIDAAVSHEGEIAAWDTTLSNQEFVQKYISPYLKTEKCSNYYIAPLLPGLEHNLYSPWDYRNNNLQTYCINNGMTFTYTNKFADIDGVYISVDLNGKAGPNRAGADVFTFEADKTKNRLIAYHEGYSRSNLTTPGKTRGSCNTEHTNWYIHSYGANCAALIILDGWKINDEYPIKF